MSIATNDHDSFYEDLTSLYFKIHLFVITLLLLYVFCGDFSNDASEYALHWASIRDLSFLAHFSRIRFEFGFALMYWTIAQFMSAGACFYAIASTTALVKFYLLNKHLYYKFWSWIAYVLIFLHLHDANQIRSSVSACFILYALLTPTRLKNILILAGLAIFFHYSGAIILFLIMLQFAPILGLVMIAFLGIGWNFLIKSASFIKFAYVYMSHGNGSVSLHNSMFWAQVGIAVCTVVIWKKLSSIQKKGAYFNLVGIVFYLSFLNNPLLAHRMRELSMLGLIPLIFHQKVEVVTKPILIMRLGLVYIAAYNFFKIVEKLITVYS